MNYYYNVVYVNGVYVAYIANKLVLNFEVFIACCESDDINFNTAEELISILDLNPKEDITTYLKEITKLQK